jgi:hypothetical protein
MGPNAPVLAVQLAEQIRTKHNMPAYIVNRGRDERRQADEEWARMRQASEEQGLPPPRRRMVRIEEQCAVLIGGPGTGWADIDGASSSLKTVKRWELPELKLGNGIPAYDIMYEPNRNAAGGKAEMRPVPVNPFTTSFVTRNPTVPQDARPKSKFDPAWEKFNKHEEYSLLKCPKPWTLVVKEYTGTTVLQTGGESSGFLEKLGLAGSKEGQGITAAGYQAHELADFLHRLGFKEVYVLHTRTSSIVTVGGFASVQDEDLLKTQDRLARLSFKGANGAPVNLGLFARPMPMEVPRR